MSKRKSNAVVNGRESLSDVNYVRLYEYILCNTDLTSTDKLVLSYMLSSNYESGFKLSRQNVTNKCGISMTTLDRSLKNLKELGFLEIINISNSPSRVINKYIVKPFGKSKVNNTEIKVEENEVLEDKITEKIDVKDFPTEKTYKLVVDNRYSNSRMNSDWIMSDYNKQTINNKLEEFATDKVVLNIFGDNNELVNKIVNGSPSEVFESYQVLYNETVKIKTDYYKNVESLLKSHPSISKLNGKKFKDIFGHLLSRLKNKLYDGEFFTDVDDTIRILLKETKHQRLEKSDNEITKNLNNRD